MQQDDRGDEILYFHAKIMPIYLPCKTLNHLRTFSSSLHGTCSKQFWKISLQYDSLSPTGTWAITWSLEFICNEAALHFMTAVFLHHFLTCLGMLLNVCYLLCVMCCVLHVMCYALCTISFVPCMMCCALCVVHQVLCAFCICLSLCICLSFLQARWAIC